MAEKSIYPAFPDKATPLVNYGGGAFTKICIDHVVATFHASRVYLIASASLTKNTSYTTSLRTALGNKLAKTRVGMTQHTMMSEVLECIQDCRLVDADCIVTLGGGSLSDAAKIISFGLANGAQTEADLPALPHAGIAETQALPANPSRIPIICIPTSLSGGEYSPYAGVTIDATSEKLQFFPPLASPSLIILDGELTTTTPLSIWLQSGVPSIDHCVEALCSLQSIAEVDAAAIHALKELIPRLLKTKNDPSDAQARHACQRGVTDSMLALHRHVLPGASHGTGHMLGPLGHVGHVDTSCILLPAVCKYNALHGRRAIRGRQRIVSDALWGIPVAMEKFEKNGLKEDQADLGDLIDVVVRELGMKRTLNEAGVRRDMFKELAGMSLTDLFLVTNPVPILEKRQVMEILEMCA